MNYSSIFSRSRGLGRCSLGAACLSVILASSVLAQTALYVPNGSGTGGVGASPNGSVGIGTNAPDSGAKLHVAGGILTSGVFSSTAGSTGGIDYYNGGLRLFSVGSGGATKGTYEFWAFGANGSVTTPVVIDAEGDVGIGTSTPSQKLVVLGNIYASGNVTTRGGDTSYYGFGEAAANLPANDLDLSRPNLPGGIGVFRVNHHTGLSISAHSYYGGIRFYNQGYAAGNNNPYDSTTGAKLALSIWDGNVGIGTPSPAARLDVVDTSGNAYARIFANNPANGRTSTLELAAGNGGDGGTASILKFSALASQQHSKLNIQNSAGTNLMTIVDAGNVGIGTTSPSAKLDVRGEVWVGGSSTPTLRLRDGSTEYATMRILSSDLAFEVVGSERMRITAGGNVGIGTSSPSHKLAVNGSIKAKEVIVETTGWSDYVFKPGYPLAPLSEVEAHIQAHGTLPGVPSEAEVAQEGVSLGDMQAKLLAKVEELTLHVIAQEKRSDAQQAEISALRAENAEFRQQLFPANRNP